MIFSRFWNKRSRYGLEQPVEWFHRVIPIDIQIPSLKLTAKAPKNGGLEYDRLSYWGKRPIFRGYVSFREGRYLVRPWCLNTLNISWGVFGLGFLRGSKHLTQVWGCLGCLGCLMGGYFFMGCCYSSSLKLLMKNIGPLKRFFLASIESWFGGRWPKLV